MGEVEEKGDNDRATMIQIPMKLNSNCNCPQKGKAACCTSPQELEPKKEKGESRGWKRKVTVEK